MENSTTKINIHLKGQNMDLTPAISDHIYKKMGAIEKHLNVPDDVEVLAEVEVGLRSRKHKKGDIYRAETNLNLDGKIIRAVSKKSDLFTAIDEMASSLERSVRKTREKKKDFARRSAAKAKSLLRGLRRK